MTVYFVRSGQTLEDGSPIDGQRWRGVDWENGVAGPMNFREANALVRKVGGEIIPQEVELGETPARPDEPCDCEEPCEDCPQPDVPGGEITEEDLDEAREVVAEAAEEASAEPCEEEPLSWADLQKAVYGPIQEAWDWTEDGAYQEDGKAKRDRATLEAVYAEARAREIV